MKYHRSILVVFAILASLNCEAFSYFSHGGLVTKADPTTENMNTFLATYLSISNDQLKKEYFENGMRLRKVRNGLHLRSPIHLTRSVSHDEITGMMVSSKILGTNHRFEIWESLKANLGSYPAVVNDWTDFLPYNPANYYSWCDLADCGDVKYLYLINFQINLILCANKQPETTSCKILYWLELSNMEPSSINMRMMVYFDKKMTEQYGKNWLSVLLHLYHNKEDETFPIFEALNENVQRGL